MTSELFNLKGKVAIVTGGNGGIGLGMARGLADAGADIAVVGRNEEKSKAAVADLAKRGVRAIAVATDVTDKSAVGRMVERIKDELGRIDILVNNAGISIRKPPHVLELGIPGDEGRRRREGHQYRVDDVDLRRKLRAGLCGEQGRHRAVYPRLRLRVGHRQHPGQCDPARLDRH